MNRIKMQASIMVRSAERGPVNTARQALRLALLVLPAALLLASPAYAHPPEIVRITEINSSGRTVEVRGQVAYEAEPDGAYFAAWNFGDGSDPVIVINNEQDAQGYTPWQSHTFPKRNGIRWYRISLWGYAHHGNFDGNSDSVTVAVVCVFGVCSTNVVADKCRLCAAPLELDLSSLEPGLNSQSAANELTLEAEPIDLETGGLQLEPAASELDIDGIADNQSPDSVEIADPVFLLRPSVTSGLGH